MANSTYLDVVNGVPTQKTALGTSVGVASAGEIPRLDAAGKLDGTMMPTGIGAEVKSLVTAEDVSAGDLVQVFDDAGTAKVRKADATAANKFVTCGFVLQGYVAPAPAAVYFEGIITGLAGLTAGTTVYLGTTAGSVNATPPTGAGDMVQRVGVAVSDTEVTFEPAQPITLAA